MNRKHVAGATVVVWLLALGWLVQRSYLRPVSAVLAETTLRVPPGATYFAIQGGSNQIGFGASQLDTLRDTIRLQDLTVLHLPVSGRMQRVESRTSTSLSRTLQLREFETTVRAEDGRFVARGTLSNDSTLAVELETVEEARTVQIKIRRPLVLPALVPLHVAFVDPAALNKQYSLQLFDPVLMTVRDVDFTVTAESTIVFPDSATFDSTAALWEPARWDTADAWRLSEDVDGVEHHMWIDGLGQVVRAESPTGYFVARTAFELAFENFRAATRDPQPSAGRSPEIVYATVIASGVPLPSTELDELEVQRYRPEPGKKIPAGYDTLVIRRGMVGGDGTEQASAHAPARYSQPGLLIESDDPRITAQARQIVGRTGNPLRQAERLNQWVFETLDKRGGAAVPSAVNVLEQRRGDSNEHTTLYVALARAVGIPARSVAGLLYVDGRFYYHAWSEVHIQRWIAVDPTLGQLPADARHIRLTTEGLTGHMELRKSIGGIRLDVIRSNGIT